MRRFALPIAICLFTAYGCAASEEPEPTAAGSASSAGSFGNGGALSGAGSGALSSAGSASTAQGGTGTAGTGTGTGIGSGGAGTTTTGTAGTMSTGGATSGSGSCTMRAASVGMPLLIDDLEDGNADIMAVDGRMGGWYLSTDGTGTVTPSAGAPVPEAGGMPGKALHVKGMGLTKWGASLSAALANNTMGCYDASKFTGLSMSLKGTGAVFVSVYTAAVRDAPEGMRNHYKKLVTLTPDWSTVTVSFAELTQPGGWGLMVPFDVTKIYGVDVSPVQATPPATTDYDYWIDNLSFR